MFKTAIAATAALFAVGSLAVANFANSPTQAASCCQTKQTCCQTSCNDCCGDNCEACCGGTCEK
jgi:hypothetical protein